MATFYVDSAAGGDDGGSNWANAFPDLVTAFADAGTVAGSDLYVDDGHSKTNYGADTTYVCKGTLAAPINVYVVDKADDSYAGKSGTGSNAAIEDTSTGVYNLWTQGFANIYGMHFKSGNNLQPGGAGDNDTWQFTDCHLELASAANSDRVFGNGSANGAFWRLINTDITFAHASQGIAVTNERFEWLGGNLAFDIDELVAFNVSGGGIVTVRGVDLSSISGGALFNGFGTVSDETNFHGSISGCNLNAIPPVLVTDTLPAGDGVYLAMIGCGSAGVPQTHVYTSQGDIIHETSVVRTATYDGTNKYSYTMTPNANVAFETPLRFKLCEQWMAADPTITAHFTHDINGDQTDANNNEIWLEIEHPNDTVAAYRQWDRTLRMATLGTPANLTTEAGVDGWTNGMGVYNSVAVTVNSSAGIHTVWACSAIPVAKAEILRVCPAVVVT